MKIAALALVICAGVFGSACSSPVAGSEETNGTVRGSTPERVTVAASAETRSTLGVSLWGIGESNRYTVIRGYDESKTPIVEYRQLASASFNGESDASAYAHTFLAQLRVNDHVSTLQVEANATTHRIVSNDFTADARQALERIEADLKNQPVSLTTKSLEPLDDFVDPNGTGCLAQACDNSLRGSAATGVGAAGACVDGTANCGPDIANAQMAQGASDASCQCGGAICVSGAVISGPAVRPHVQTFANDACCAVPSTDGSGGPCRATTYDRHEPIAALAIDIPVSPGGYGHPPDNADFANRIVAFALENKAKYKIEYVIWQQRIRFGGDGDGQPMEDRGSPTQNHYDHVHISFQP